MSTSDETLTAIFGDGCQEIFKSAGLTPAQKKARSEKRQAQVGLASNAVGLAAGTAGMSAALKDERLASGGKVARRLHRAGTGMQNAAERTKVGRKYYKLVSKPGVAPKMAVGAAGLQVANLAGDAVANRVLARSAKQGQVKKSLRPLTTNEFDITHEISKADTEKRQVFGWASIIEKDGRPVVDLQGDYIDVETIEKAAYDYMQSSRKGGYEHHREGDDPRHVSDLIESVVITEEKKKAMGLPDSVPTGWWTGYQIHDDEVWAEVKKGLDEGKQMGFSIHGRGRRTEVDIDE